MIFKCIFCCLLDLFYIQFIRSFNFTYIHINHSVYIYICTIIFISYLRSRNYCPLTICPLRFGSRKSSHLTSLNILSDSFYIFILILVLYIACRISVSIMFLPPRVQTPAITSYFELPVRAPKNFNIKKSEFLCC